MRLSCNRKVKEDVLSKYLCPLEGSVSLEITEDTIIFMFIPVKCLLSIDVL